MNDFGHSMDILLLLVSYVWLAAGVGQARRHVHGISNSSINLTSFDRFLTKDFTLKRDINETRYLIAKMKDGVMVNNSDNRYMLWYNGTVIGIKELTTIDSGLYIIDFTFLNGTTKEEEIYLTVWEPIPPVQIHIKDVKIIEGQCNVTLHCYVPSHTSDFNYTWKYSQRESEYQRINNTGNTIQISLPPDHQDTEFICRVSNPAEQKNTSVIIKPCSEENAKDWSIGAVVILAVVILAVVALAVVLWICWKRLPCTKGYVKEKTKEHVNGKECTEVLMADTSDQDEEMQIQGVEEHENDEHESEELLITPPTDISDLDEEMRTQRVEEHENNEHENEEPVNEEHANEGHAKEGHENEKQENEGHAIEEQENEEHENEGHANEEHENEGHANEEHANEEHANEGHENEEQENEGHAIEEQENEGHANEEHENKGHANEEHANEEHANEGHANEEHENEEQENEGHANEEHLVISVKESYDQDEEVEEHEKNEPENEKHLTIPVEESGKRNTCCQMTPHMTDDCKGLSSGQLIISKEDKEEDRTSCEEPLGDQNEKIKEPENEENLTIPVQDTGNVIELRQDLDEKARKKIEHLNEDEHTGGLLQDTNDQDEQKKVEEHEKKDGHENEDDLTLVEGTGDQKGGL